MLLVILTLQVANCAKHFSFPLLVSQTLKSSFAGFGKRLGLNSQSCCFTLLHMEEMNKRKIVKKPRVNGKTVWIGKSWVMFPFLLGDTRNIYLRPKKSCHTLNP